jgi:hypothetical protein
MTAQPFGARDIYRSFRADRNVALHRVLARLPDALDEVPAYALA